jgi:hypothetical protein
MADVSAIFWPFVNLMSIEKASYDDVFRSEPFIMFCDACEEENGLFISKECLDPLHFDENSFFYPNQNSKWRYDKEYSGFWACNPSILFDLVIKLYDQHEYFCADEFNRRSEIVRHCRNRMTSYLEVINTADNLMKFDVS